MEKDRKNLTAAESASQWRNAFYEYCKEHSLTPREKLLWYVLLSEKERLGWNEWFKLETRSLASDAGLSLIDLLKTKNSLVEAHLLAYQNNDASTFQNFRLILPKATNHDEQPLLEWELAFFRRCERYNDLTFKAKSLWYHLLIEWDNEDRPEWIELAENKLARHIGCSITTVRNARVELVDSGLIIFKRDEARKNLYKVLYPYSI